MKLWRVDDVMTKDVVAVQPGTGYQDLAKLLIERKVTAVPVADRFGYVLGVVSEVDPLSDEVLWRQLSLEPDKVRAATAEGVVTLSGRTRCRSTSERAVRLVRQVPGVVDVVDRLTYDIDDRAIFRFKAATPAGVT